MSKAVLIMDMPESCLECPLCNSSDECIIQDEDANFKASDSWDKLKESCPLREIPQKLLKTGEQWVEGYNACIDEILKRKTN